MSAVIPVRTRLPHRRTQVTERIEVGPASYIVSIGIEFTPEREIPREVFIEGPKAGSDMAFVLTDAAVLISLALQYGIPPAVLARSMSRAPSPIDGEATEPGSPIGAAIDFLVRCDGEGCR